jgi:para-nitrobenzyl esterase
MVTCAFGTARGIRRGPIDIFKGIRYATSQRFGAPEPTGAWKGEYDATRYGAQAHQILGMMEQALGSSSMPMAEDCLFLNVFTPGCDDGARPVLVWVHGGAFTTGSGSMPWYDGCALAERGDVVVVTINYRLGALGFAGTGNAGLRDQICALGWVHDAIAAFGGDPRNVTVFGESAGGSALVALMAAPAADGLFQRAFAMSPSINQLRSGARAEEALAEFVAAAGATSLEGLHDAPVQQILDAQAELLKDVGAGFTGFSPCSDGELIPHPILEAAAHNPLPLTLGTTRDEMSLFTAFNPALADLGEDLLRSLFARRFGDGACAAVEAYRAARPGAGPKGLASAMQTDEVFRVPARRLAEARASCTWMYWFTWASPAFGGALGSCHALDIPFAFHNLHRKGVEQFTGNAPDRSAVADAYSAAVLAFARSGDPGWPVYDTGSRITRRFDVDTADLTDPEPELRALWATA